jgi:hypothetical protein
MKDKKQIPFEKAYDSLARIFEAEAQAPAQTPGTTEVPAPAPAKEVATAAELTPTEEQILMALLQKLGPEQFMAKVTQLTTPQEEQPAATPAV